jgi:hypothetical protein
MNNTTGFRNFTNLEITGPGKFPNSSIFPELNENYQ